MPNSNKSALILAYQKLITSKKISIDIAQKEVLRRLDILGNQLIAYVERNKGNFRRFLFNRSARDRRPQGVYIFGDVGRGKTFVMDLFYENLPPEVKATRRHFHEFMKEVHEEVNLARDEGRDNVVEFVARKIARTTILLCLDEMQVNDISDAMILGRLFESLFLNGVTVVVTSNRHPDDLYKDGLQRERFIPFIEMFKQNMDIQQLNGLKDYRLAHLKDINRTYFYPLGKDSETFIERVYRNLAGSIKANDKQKVHVKGRVIKVPKSHRGVAQFSFKELCDIPLGAEDYLEIAKQFKTVIITDIPKLSKEDHNQAIRFTNLVDVFYENKTKIVCSAEVEPKELYTEGERSFEFERTVSRLIEMQSEQYLSEEHIA